MNPANTVNPTTSYPTKLPGFRGDALSEVYEASGSAAFTLPAPESYPAAYCIVAHLVATGASTGSGMVYLPSASAAAILAGVSNLVGSAPNTVQTACANSSGALLVTPGANYKIRVTRVI